MNRIVIGGFVLLAACAQQKDASPPAASAAQQPINEDSVIFARTIERAYRERLDTLPIGEVVARVGTWFVGTPYKPGTLEQPGAERLMINLREFDCVTYLENMLAFGNTIRARERSFAHFTREIERYRYRNGQIDGYPSRLHYFSEWIADNDRRGIVKNLTPSLGVPDREPIDFMTTHREAYRQLADPRALSAVADTERRLSIEPRWAVPEAQIARIEKQVRNGDIIAATTSGEGLDVVHTGIAIWKAGRLHLMHAPLVGDSVEISDRPLAERILRIGAQDGIMVARPL